MLSLSTVQLYNIALTSSTQTATTWTFYLLLKMTPIRSRFRSLLINCGNTCMAYPLILLLATQDEPTLCFTVSATTGPHQISKLV